MPYFSFIEPIKQDLVVPLWRYAQILEHDECAIWNVTYEGQPDSYGCNLLWSEERRRTTQEALYEAQVLIEDLVGFFLKPTYVFGELDDAIYAEQRFLDQQPISTYRFHARYAHLLEFGKGTLSTLSSGEAVSHAADPATIGPVTVTIGSTEEVKLYHPGSDREIRPSSMTYTGGALTIRVPRCRLVLESKLSEMDPLQYTDTANFESTVDIKRLYTDTTDNGDLVVPHACPSGSSCTCRCSEYTHSACGYIKDAVTGFIDFIPATYDADTSSWLSPSNQAYCNYSMSRLCYKAGLRNVTPLVERAIVRLAHTLMPKAPCSCDVLQSMWERDRNIPVRLSRAREYCRFGQMDGAWFAWQEMRGIQILRGTTI